MGTGIALLAPSAGQLLGIVFENFTQCGQSNLVNPFQQRLLAARDPGESSATAIAPPP
jgi:hypothetical protein